jgi:hypothetical protein
VKVSVRAQKQMDTDSKESFIDHHFNTGKSIQMVPDPSKKVAEDRRFFQT